MGAVKDAHTLVYSGDVGTIGVTTWGDLYSRMEKLRIKGLMSIAIAIALLFVGILFMFNNSLLLTGVSLGLAGYYYRNYVGSYGMYAGLYGGRHVVVPNLNVK